MKNIVVIFCVIIVFGLMVITYKEGSAFQGGEAGKIIEDISKNHLKKTEPSMQKIKSDDEKLNTLREKAGNVSLFKVSKKYKSKCASCHGVDGLGIQNGKKMMGAKLFGQSEEKIYKALVDFKAGRVENSVMRGLLLGLSDDDLKEFAKEIGEFKARSILK